MYIDPVIKEFQDEENPRLPKYKTACMFCRNAKWHTRGRVAYDQKGNETGEIYEALVCFCELYSDDIWTEKEPTIIPRCAAQILSEQEAGGKNDTPI